MNIAKRIASMLPLSFQQRLKRRHFSRQIRSGTFVSGESEFKRLDEWVKPGDWVLDIGANIGQYSARLSALVGSKGRVISFEPVPMTFELLAANAAQFPHKNVTLINAAASNAVSIAGISMPKFETGLDNFYMASLTSDKAELTVMCLPIDTLQLPHEIALIKIDVEGHELAALQGMLELLRRDKPVLIVEGHIDKVAELLAGIGYSFTVDEGSSNRVYSAR